MSKAIVELQGGLGNQMGQYSFGLRLAKGFGYDVFHETKFFNGPFAPHVTPRNLELLHFENCVIRTYSASYYSSRSLIKRWARKIKGTHTFSQVSEDGETNPLLALPKGDLLFSGYWISFENIVPVIAEVKHSFAINDKDYSDCYFQLKHRLQKTSNTVGLHIRRGDYADNPEVAKNHPVLPRSYYTQAMDYIRSKINNPVFVFFSDDISWVKKMFAEETALYVESTESHFEDMALMRQCQHMITANSTFSWWASVLGMLSNERPSVRIYPEKWNMKSPLRQDRDPYEWIAIPSF